MIPGTTPSEEIKVYEAIVQEFVSGGRWFSNEEELRNSHELAFKTLTAFSHYVYQWSRKEEVLVELQGMSFPWSIDVFSICYTFC